MKITYNVTGPARKELVNAIAHLLAVAPVYQGPPSFAYNIGTYVVDKNGNLNTPDEATTDDVFRLVDALYAEYEYKPEEPLAELFPDTETEPEEEEPEADEAEDSDETDETDETEEEAEDTNEGIEAETLEQPEPEADDAPETPPVAGDFPVCEDDTEEAEEAPENGDFAPDEGEETAEASDPVEDEAMESAEDTEEAESSDEVEDSDDSRLTLSLPREKFSDAAIDRLRALVQSKQTLLKKVFETEELTIIVNDGQIMFPWFTLHGIDGEVDAYAKFIHAIALRALTSSRISSTEKPTDNDKFTMRLFLNNLGFKGEEYKFARRFLIRNLEGNGAWRYGNAPSAFDCDLDMPTVFKPTVTPPVQDEPTEAVTEAKTEAESDVEQEEVGNGEEESTDEE